VSASSYSDQLGARRVPADDLQVVADHELVRVHAVADPDLDDLQVVSALAVAALAGAGVTLASLLRSFSATMCRSLRLDEVTAGALAVEPQVGHPGDWPSCTVRGPPL
jgi:hypothetical protein